MLFQEGRLVRKCWLGIQSSFISCLIIFLDLALARREYNSQPTPEDVELVAKCIAALEFCACTDTVAKAYLEILLPIRNVLIFGPRPHTSIRPQRPQYLQHRSSSHSSSASSSMSRSPSASPSKRPRVLPSSRSNSSTSMSVGNSPTYIGSSFQHRGSFHWTTTTNRMDQMFRPEDGVITGSDPRIHLLITHILEHIYSPYGGEKRFSEDQFQQGNNSVKRRYIDLKTKAPGTNSSMGPPSSISTPCSYQHIQHNQYDQHYTPQNGQGVQQRQNQPHNSSHHHGHTYRYKSSGAECPTVATSGGPLPNVWMETGEDYDVNGRRRRKMPFKSMEEYENFLRRVA